MSSNPLTDLLPPKVRLYLYAGAFLAAVVVGVWQASEGDWTTFVGALLAALPPLLAGSNVQPEPRPRRRR